MMQLPIDKHLEQIRHSVENSQVTVVDSPPGSGKSTRVAPFLSDHYGKIYMLQPRRVATKMVVSRIAEERKWSIGAEVGYRIRGEKKVSSQSVIEIMTEGVLTQLILKKKGHLDCDVLILDEFHERSIHCDLIASWYRHCQVRKIKVPKLVIMSATLQGINLGEYFESISYIKVDTPIFPLKLNYQPFSVNFHDYQKRMDQLVSVTKRACESHPNSSVLVFLPGVADIQNYLSAVKSVASGWLLLPLHGRMKSAEQAEVLQPSSVKRIIASTNVAETSITVSDVDVVIDSGLEKVGGTDLKTGEDYLYLQRISLNSAIQRAGRAARTGPGHCYKLWTQADERKMAQTLEPEILRSDFQLPLFFLHSLGLSDPEDFPWLSKPENYQIAECKKTLEWMEVIEANQITEFGHKLSRYPTSIRLAALLERGSELNCYRAACKVAAVVESGYRLSRPDPEMKCDVEMILESFADIRKNANVQNSFLSFPKSGQIASSGEEKGAEEVDDNIYYAVMKAFPDRIVQRRKPGSMSGKMTSGRGIKLKRESNCKKSEYFIALNTKKFSQIQSREGDVDLASHLEKKWIEQELNSVMREETEIDEAKSLVIRVRKLGEISISESAPQKLTGDDLIANLIEKTLRNISSFYKDHPEVTHFLSRIRYASTVNDSIVNFDESDVRGILEIIFSDHKEREVQKLDLTSFFEQWLNNETLQLLNYLAPADFRVGRRRPCLIEYDLAKGPFISMTLQVAAELKRVPMIGDSLPLGIELLAPSRRPIQFTKDIKGFWQSSYPQIRKELKGRYPKHYWPETVSIS